MSSAGADRHDAPDLGAAEPVTIDLGNRVVFEVEVVVQALDADGLRVYLVAQDEWAQRGGNLRKHCRLLVHPDDASLARARLAIAGLL